jgi:hypothetical protein
MHESLSRTIESLIGVPVADLESLQEDQLQSLCLRIRQRHEFENAVKDFMTIVLTTPLICDGEESLRIDLLKIPQLLWAREWETAMHASDEEFSNARLAREDQPLLELLTLLRATRRPQSQTEEARTFMLHGQSYPTEYNFSEHQRMFASLIEFMRGKQYKE